MPRHPQALRAAAAALALFASCTRPAAGPSAASVFAELVEAGCVAQTPDGPQAVADEHADHSTVWVECMFSLEGGTVASCQVPCP